MMSQQELLFEKEDRVAIATLNLPDKLNALSPGIVAGLWQALDDVRTDDSIRVLVITGVGRGFCSGADVQSLVAGTGEQDQQAPSTTRSLADIPAELRKLPKPVIGAINGVAAGGGLSIALACDIRIASDNARFIAVWIRRALLPDLGAHYMLPRTVGLSKACEMIFTGDTIDAKEAERIGLVSKAVPHEQLMSTTMELARRLAKGPPIAIQLAKRAIYEAQHMDLEATVELENLGFAMCLRSEDAGEGTRAFLEKREPEFRGR